MPDQQPPLPNNRLTQEQNAARRSRALGLGVALALFALILYLATLARLIG